MGRRPRIRWADGPGVVTPEVVHVRAHASRGGRVRRHECACAPTARVQARMRMCTDCARAGAPVG
eukprot:6204627-Alexandrium_andersonii.AAC.1